MASRPSIAAQKQTLYLRHPYRLSEIGHPQSLLQLEVEDIADCHRRTCLGGNTVIVVSGRVDAENVRQHLASLFDSVPSGDFAGASVEEEIDAPRTTIVTRPRSHGALAVGYRGIPWNEETWCALEIVKALLVGPENNSVRGRLMRAMREEGAAYGVHCSNQAGFGEGHFAIAAAYAAEHEDRVVAIVAREIERLRAGDITSAELDHCRKLYLLHHLREYEWPRGHAYAVGRHMLFSSRPAGWRTVAGELARIRVEDVASVASRAFPDRRMGLVLARPQGGRP